MARRYTQRTTVFLCFVVGIVPTLTEEGSLSQSAKRSSQHLACQRDFALHKLAKKLQEANLAARRRRRQRQQQETAASERGRRATPATAEAAAATENDGERARNERHPVPTAESSNGRHSTFRPVRSFFSRTVLGTEDNLTLLCRFLSESSISLNPNAPT